MRSRPDPTNQYEWFSKRIRLASNELTASLGTRIEKAQIQQALRFLKGAAIYLQVPAVIKAIDACQKKCNNNAVKGVIEAFDNAKTMPAIAPRRRYNSDEIELSKQAAMLLRAHRQREESDLKEIADDLVGKLGTENLQIIKGIWEQCQNIAHRVDFRDEQVFIFDAMSELYFDCVIDFAVAPDWMLEMLQEQLLKIELGPETAPPVVTAAPPEGKTAEIDPDILEVFLEEISEITEELDPIMNAPSTEEGLAVLLRHLHTLKGGARMVGLTDFGGYIHDVEQKIEPIKEDVNLLNEENWSSTGDLWEDIKVCFASLSQGQTTLELIPLIERMQMVKLIQSAASAPVEPIPQSSPAVHAVSSTDITDEIADKELVEVFLEEAQELLPEIRQALDDIEGDLDNLEPVEIIKRHLHTLKGGARMVGQSKIGQYVHDIEDSWQEQIPSGSIAKAVFETLQTQHQILEEAVSLLDQAFHKAKPNVRASELPQTGDQLKSKEASKAKPVNPGKQMLRVSMEDMNKFNSLIGVATVARTQVEADIMDVELTLSKLSDAVIEIQSLVVSLKQGLSSDKVSGQNIHQMVDNIEERLGQILRDNEHTRDRLYAAENLLFDARQAVVELQRGLTNVQLVKVSSVVPRLRIMVEQLCTELSKDIVFAEELGDEEIDRQTLERLIPVFEHMLRNAIDHGIDTPENRKSRGKDPRGTITLAVKRSGTDTLISFKDDGRGINVDGVRRKAIDKGVLDPEARLSDEEVLRYILQPGFSTSQAVTKISGRGVGMDVVNSEIEKMGGNLLLSTIPDGGTTFTIVLPFTQSLNEVLLFSIDENWYAFPGHSITDIVRIPYEAALDNLDSRELLHVDKIGYTLRYLGEMLHGKSAPAAVFSGQAMPTILLKVADTALALLVDHVIGARKVVTKSPGPQISNLNNFSGACILPNGQVVMILDAVVLEHAALHDRQHNGKSLEIQGASSIHALVVDDSSTVRKMSKALLEKNQFKVSLAKDGVDAIKKLENLSPDIILLDIDMPRMNGYEVAEKLQRDPRLKHVPVIVISSRNNTEHQAKAKNLGVKSILTKPFSEKHLVETIKKLVGEK